MHVEADLFSGRPNPGWTLDAREAEEFSRLFRGLPEGGAGRQPFEGLGYRGMVVRGAEACEEVRVRGGR